MMSRGNRWFVSSGGLIRFFFLFYVFFILFFFWFFVFWAGGGKIEKKKKQIKQNKCVDLIINQRETYPSTFSAFRGNQHVEYNRK